MKICGWPEEEAFAVFRGEVTLNKNTCTSFAGALELTVFGDEQVIVIADGKTYYFKRLGNWSHISDGDILSISEKGIVSVLYRRDQPEIDLFLTNKCNSNCIMCPVSEHVRRKSIPLHHKWILDYVYILPKDIPYINITGGEPTFEMDHFLEIMKVLKGKYQYTEFQLLTNGRSFADYYFLRDAVACMPNNIRISVPLHSSDEKIHDCITRSRGSFRQTDSGIRNLLYLNQKVEIRIVITKENIETIKETVCFIVNNYTGVFVVTFIGMEMMGNAFINRERIWEDYCKLFPKIRESIVYLVSKGIDAQLYNFPLCAVDKGFWPLTVRSITGYKIRYKKECDQCLVKTMCGGFFYSTLKIMDPKIKVIHKL